MRTECRPFRLSDAMILMAAMGLGMGWLIYKIRSEPGFLFPLKFSSPRSSIVTAWWNIEWAVPPFVILLAPATLVLGLRRPRPPRRWAWRRPGQVACLIAVALSILDAALRTLDAISRHVRLRRALVNYSDSLGEAVFEELMNYPNIDIDIGLGVLVAWTTLAISGCWRPSSCWIDRLGRALGLAWITVNIVVRARDFVFPFQG